MSEQNPEQPQNPPQGDEAPPSVEPVTPTEQPGTTFEPVGQPDTQTGGDETTSTDSGQKAVDASEDPNLGHALEDQAAGVGVGPSQGGDAGEGNPGTHPQTTEEVEQGTAGGDDTASAV